MTTGNKTWDYRSTVVTPSGNRFEGSYANKSWNGANSPSVNGKLALRENDYTCSLERYYTTPIACRSSPTGNPTYITSRDLCQPNNFSWSTNDDLELWTRLANKMRQEDFSLGVFIVDGKESLEMIADAAHRLAKGMEQIASRDFRRARRTFGLSRSKVGDIGKTAASAVLAYRLGWEPIVGDLVTAAKFVHALTNRDLVVRYEASLRRNRPEKPVLKVSFLAHTCFELKKLRAHFPAPIPAFATLGLDAPEQVTWEGLPATWLLDYTAPIGDYLATVGLFARIENYQSSVARYYETTYRYYESSGIKSKPGGYFVTPDPFSNLTYRYVKRVRIPNALKAIPLPSFRPLGEVASWRHATNAMAYLAVKKSKIDKLFKRNYGQ